jgi:hypothetical protein
LQKATQKNLFTDGGAGDMLLLQKEPFTSGAVNLISQKGEVTSGLLFFISFFSKHFSFGRCAGHLKPLVSNIT